ncbi:MAG: hypothetical protein WC782_14590 [Methylococcaceae bacterium]|jgi:hypothetical protein
MKSIMKLVAFLAMTAAAPALFAEATGEAEVRAAAEGTVAKIQEALSLSEKGVDKEEVNKVINDARQLQKEFRYERTERQRQKAGNLLRVARDEIEKGDKVAGETALKTSLASFQEMLKVYLAAH